MEQGKSDGHDEVGRAESDSSFDVVVVGQGADHDEEREEEINERSPLDPPVPVAVLEGQNLDLEKKPFPYKLSKRVTLSGERRKFNSVSECFTVFWILSGLILCAIILSFSVLFVMKIIQTYDASTGSLKTISLNETSGNSSLPETTSSNEPRDQDQVPACNITKDYFVEPVHVDESVFKRLRQLESYDCDHIKTAGGEEDLPDGPYVLQMRVGLSLTRARVRCDMTSFGGGWTVIQRRGSFENPDDFFNRSWTEYTRGFGDEEGEYWLGLDMVTTMAEIKEQELLVQFWDVHDNVYFASYSYFSLSNDGLYKLNVGSFAGNATESLGYSFDEPFSATDRDNDRNATRNCAAERGGGWWYRDCAPANLNGLSPSLVSESAKARARPQQTAMNWGEVRATKSEIKIRPKDSTHRSDWHKIWPVTKENESKLIS